VTENDVAEDVIVSAATVFDAVARVNDAGVPPAVTEINVEIDPVDGAASTDETLLTHTRKLYVPATTEPVAELNVMTPAFAPKVDE
jgi:hypothetical protein